MQFCGIAVLREGNRVMQCTVEMQLYVQKLRGTCSSRSEFCNAAHGARITHIVVASFFKKYITPNTEAFSHRVVR